MRDVLTAIVQFDKDPNGFVHSLYCFFFFAFSHHRRRLPVVMVKLRMSERVRDAVGLVEQGRILHTIVY